MRHGSILLEWGALGRCAGGDELDTYIIHTHMQPKLVVNFRIPKAEGSPISD